MFDFIFSYFLTLLIEIPIFFHLSNKKFSKNLLFKLILINSITLFIIWFLFPLLNLDYSIQISLSELFVFLVESLLFIFLINLKLKDAIKISFIANLISFLIGFILF